MRWEFKKLLRHINWSDPSIKFNDVGVIRNFASKYFKDTWRQRLSKCDYDIDQLREFKDLIDWETWYYWKGKSVKWYILTEFKDRCKSMREDYDKWEQRYGVEFMRGHKRETNV